jgi:deazaflavin-dependent oxidoreductase (nitroreductase family)
MTFSSKNGTRGARQPGAGFLMRLVNKWAMRRARTGGKLFGDTRALVLTTVGSKSGVERSTPVNYFPGEDGTWLIVASAAGAARNPAWYHNLAAHPEQVRIELDGRLHDVVAEQLHGSERADAWTRIANSSKRFAQYQTKTDRELPIIRLAPR